MPVVVVDTATRQVIAIERTEAAAHEAARQSLRLTQHQYERQDDVKALSIREAIAQGYPVRESLAAATLGRIGGSARTDAKSAAARANGSKGGRPGATPTAAVFVGATPTGRRSATADGARLAAKRAGFTPTGPAVFHNDRWVVPAA